VLDRNGSDAGEDLERWHANKMRDRARLYLTTSLDQSAPTIGAYSTIFALLIVMMEDLTPFSFFAYVNDNV